VVSAGRIFSSETECELGELGSDVERLKGKSLLNELLRCLMIGSGIDESLLL